jgi:cell division protein FtsI/penicillin-binding protein 2
MSEAELRKKLDSDRQFVYLKRQVEPQISDKIQALAIPGVETRKEYKRFYPEGEVMAHVVGFTNVEDIGQEGIELASEKIWQVKRVAVASLKTALVASLKIFVLFVNHMMAKS